MISSEEYQNQHKAAAAIKEKLEAQRQKMKEDIQRRKMEKLQKQKVKMEERLEKINKSMIKN
jgi:hypothetical protein